ncbi:hypothetical protein ScPMuIL_008794 [Solemya velum]
MVMAMRYQHEWLLLSVLLMRPGLVLGHTVLFDREKALQIVLSKCGPRQLCDPRKFETNHTPVPDSDYCTTCGDECYCDSVCDQLEDCCLDVELGLTDPTTIHPINASVVCVKEQNFVFEYPWNKTIIGEYTTMNGIRLVSSCSMTGGIAPDLIDKCENTNLDDFYSLVPVTSTKSYLTYPNKYCALCNLDSDVVQWRHMLFCKEYSAINMVRQYADFIREMRTGGCRVKFRTPKTLESRRCPWYTARYTTCRYTAEFSGYDPLIQAACEGDLLAYNNKKIFCEICNTYLNDTDIIGSCPTNNSDHDHIEEKLITGCHDSNLVAPLSNTRIFKNIYCYWCNTKSKHSGTCGPIFPNIHEMFDHLFGLTKLISKMVNQVPKCREGFYHDSIKKKCRAVLCPLGRVMVEGKCQMLLRNSRGLRYELHVELYSQWNVTDSRPDCQIWNNVVIDDIQAYISAGLKDVTKYLPDEEGEYISYLVHTDNIGRKNGLEVVGYTHKSDVYIDMVIGNRRQYLDREAMEDMLLALLHRQFSIHLDSGLLVNVRSFPSERLRPAVLRKGANDSCTLTFGSGREHPPPQRVSHLLQCPQINLTSDDFIREGESVIIHGVRQVDSSYYDVIDDQSMLICLSAYELIKAPTSLPDEILTYTTLIISIVSSVCLLVSFATYCLFQELRNVPGKNNMLLIINLLMAVVLYQTVVRVKVSGGLCLVLGATLHYFWLCLFTSMNVCCYHMYRVFSKQFVVSRDMDQNQNTTRNYVIYTFGLPMLVVSATISVKFGLYNYPDVVYAGDFCFLNSIYSLVVAFIGPIMVVLLSNLLLFIATLYGLSKSPKIPGRDFSRNRRLCLVYLKLYTITGITWILQVVNSLVTVSVLSYTANILNAAQGVFIFLSFMCNQRIVRLYKNFLSNNPTPEVDGPRQRAYVIATSDDTQNTPM